MMRNAARLRTGLMLAVAVLAMGWLGGLSVYYRGMSNIPHPGADRTDALVVLTGGGGRLEAGLDLLARGYAHKLLISGVYRGVDVSTLVGLSRQSPEAFARRITLGYDAANTVENAAESARWMRRQGYSSLRLITANYHMARSLLEFRHAMPGFDIVPHPVVSGNLDLTRWWRPAAARLILTEYNKYLIAAIAVRLFREGGE